MIWRHIRRSRWPSEPSLVIGKSSGDPAATSGPAQWRDASIEVQAKRHFKIREAINFEFRAESFNTFNHTEFNNIGNNFGDSKFGQATNTWDPRVLQFGGKFNF